MANDDLLTYTSKVDALVDRIDALLDHQQVSNTQTVIHKSDGAGILVGVSIACVFVLIGYIVMDNRSFAALQGDMRDMKAWNEVLRQKVAKLEAQPEKAH